MIRVRSSIAGKLGTVASTICAVHCVLTALALGILSTAGLGFLVGPEADLTLVCLSLGLSIVALIHGVRKHHSAIPAMFFMSGLGLTVLGHFLFEGQVGDAKHAAMTVLGGICLVIFNLVNIRMAKRCGCSHCHHGG